MIIYRSESFKRLKSFFLCCSWSFKCLVFL